MTELNLVVAPHWSGSERTGRFWFRLRLQGETCETADDCRGDVRDGVVFSCRAPRASEEEEEEVVQGWRINPGLLHIPSWCWCFVEVQQTAGLTLLIIMSRLQLLLVAQQCRSTCLQIYTQPHQNNPNQTCTPPVRTWSPVLSVSSDFSQSGWEVKQEELKRLKPGCWGEQRGVSPVDSSSTDGGDGGVDPRPEHGHSAPGAVRRTQNQHAVLRQLSSTGHTGHRERHWSIHNSSVNHRQEVKSRVCDEPANVWNKNQKHHKHFISTFYMLDQKTKRSC